MLRLNCEKAMSLLDWKPALDVSQTIDLTMSWYKNYYEVKSPIREFSEQQIDLYIESAINNKLAWTH